MAVLEKITYKLESFDKTNLLNKEASLSLKINTDNSKYILHRAVVAQDSAFRKGNACTKTRSEVKAGGKKPWKQKGTGQARAGSKNSPLWKGGGVTFGPKPHSYKKKINQKEWRLALHTALYLSNKKIKVVENFVNSLESSSTKHLAKKLSVIINLEENNLLIAKDPNQKLFLSTRNIANLKVLYSNTLNIKDILRANNIIITEDALENIQNIYHD
jgi:large subunit ribosomal protein L4